MDCRLLGRLRHEENGVARAEDLDALRVVLRGPVQHSHFCWFVSVADSRPRTVPEPGQLLDDALNVSARRDSRRHDSTAHPRVAGAAAIRCYLSTE